MIAPPTVVDEIERLAALDGYSIIDTEPEDSFDDIVRLATMYCEAPIGWISLVDATRQWFKARVGIEARETAREISFCGHAILGRSVFVVPDAQTDPRFMGNPLVLGDPGIRFYAGAPLTTPGGQNLGTLCVMDRQPRQLTADQLSALTMLARQVVTQLELRRITAVHSAAEDELRRCGDPRDFGAHMLDVSEPREVERMKREFISTVSHELRTPLTALRGSLGLLASGAMGEFPEEARPMLAVAERNSVRLMCLLDDILDSDKLQAGRMEMTAQPSPLRRILERAIADSVSLAGQEGVAIDLLCSDLRVMGDADRLVQVTTNLLSNAIKYSHRGGSVTVIATRVRGWAEVRVVDRGRGIAPGLQQKLFQRFQRADFSDARTKPGTGLGLSICKAIIEQHGGTIGVESSEGQGSTFWFRLFAITGIAGHEPSFDEGSALEGAQ